MAKLTGADRAALPDRAFAYIDSKAKRGLPIHDISHVRNALSRFDPVNFEPETQRTRPHLLAQSLRQAQDHAGRLHREAAPSR